MSRVREARIPVPAFHATTPLAEPKQGIGADGLGRDLGRGVTHDRRRDHRAYLEAKKCADVLGTSVTFADPDGDANNEPTAYRDANHLETESHLFILAGKCQPREYQRLTSLARAKLKSIVPLRSWDDAPDPVREALKVTNLT